MFGILLERGQEQEGLVPHGGGHNRGCERRFPRAQIHIQKRKPPLRYGAGFVENDGVHFAQSFKHAAVAYQNSRARGRTHCRRDGERRRQA